MKKAVVIFLVLAMFTAVAFAAEAPAAEPTPETAPVMEVPKLEGPYLVTTCGQSPGAVMVSMSAMQAGVKATHNNSLTAQDIAAGEFKTLIVTSGTSMKGMGAAGTNVDAEIERCMKVIEAAKAADMVIVGAHIEGMARRTDSSDAASIEAVMGAADVILVIEDSDSDGFFTQYAQENQKPLIKVKDALGIGPVLQ